MDLTSLKSVLELFLVGKKPATTTAGGIVPLAHTEGALMGTEGTTPTPTLVTSKLAFTTAQRERLVSAFTESSALKVRRVKALLPYHKWTVAQIIAALHESADRDGEPLVIDSKSESTMKRSHVIAKAWHVTEANALVNSDDDDLDAIFTYLSQIADITGAALEAYLVPEEERDDPKVVEYREVVIPASGTTPEYAVDIPHGSGNGAIPAILAEYVTHRLKDETGTIAADWLLRYRNAVRFASNERRKAGQAHQTQAADANVGNGDGSAPKPSAGNPGARNQGGTGSTKSEPSGPDTTVKTTQIAAHKQPGDKTLREATLADLIVALTKRVVDYSVAITPEDAKAWDEMAGHYDTRFEHIPLGKTAVKASEAMAALDAEATAKQTAVNTAPVIDQDAIIRAVMASLTASGVVAPQLALVG